jgi:hypothetical protein
MTIEQKVEKMKTMMSDTPIEDDTAIVYLDLAESRIKNHIYPFGSGSEEMPSRYDYQQIELAIVLFNESGVEGQETHNENGVNRKYRSVEAILKSIPKYAGLPK